ncbi:hypothetical protein ACWEP8_39805 [Streptomyces hydrogenans]
MSKQPRPMPEPTSPIGEAARKIRVSVDPLKVGDGTQDKRRQDDEHQDDGLFEEPERSGLRPKPKPGRTRGGQSAPPAAVDAIPTTIRFDPEEAAAIDLWILSLREAAGRRRLDKAEVFRELVRLAQQHGPTERALLKRL